MKRIWKFDTPDPDSDKDMHLMLPRGAKIVWVAEGQMWIEGRFGEVEELEAIFSVHGTGNPIDEHLQYVGSYRSGPFIWHIYVYAVEDLGRG
jgi:hypothetical protein